MAFLMARVLLAAACGGFAAFWDARTRTIPDLAWIAGFMAATVLAVIGGRPAILATLAGAAIPALAFLPGRLLRSGGRPMVPVADYLLGIALGALAGLAALRGLLLVAFLGLLYGLVCLAVGRLRGGAWPALLAERPPFAPILALAFVAAIALQAIA